MRRSASAILCAVLWAASASPAEGPVAHIVLRWKEVSGAVEYDLEIAKDAAFTDVVVREKSTTPGFRWKEIPTVSYFWRVRSVDASGRKSPWSAVRTIDAEVAPPALASPAAGAVVLTGETARAVELTFRTSEVLQAYRIEVSTDARFTQRMLERKAGPAPVAFTPPALGTYYWRVAATDLKGRDTGFGEVRSFQLRLGAPRPAAPAEGFVMPWATQPVVELSWRPVLAAMRYRVEVRSSGAVVHAAAAARPAMTVPLSGAGRYTWRVRSEADGAPSSEWSAPASFTVEAEPQPVAAAPLPEAPPPVATTAAAPDAGVAAVAPIGVVTAPPLEPPRVQRVGLAARAGWNANFEGPSSPYAALEVRVKTPLFGDRLGVSLRGGFHAASAQATVAPSGDGVAIDAQIFSAALLASFELAFSRARVFFAAGPTLALARVTVGVERQSRVVGGGMGLLGAGVRLGRFEPFAEVGYALGRLDDAGAVLGTGGLMIGAGCVLWL